MYNTLHDIIYITKEHMDDNIISHCYSDNIFDASHCTFVAVCLFCFLWLNSTCSCYQCCFYVYLFLLFKCAMELPEPVALAFLSCVLALIVHIIYSQFILYALSHPLAAPHHD